MTNYFTSPFSGIRLSEQVTNPNILVGRYSYYSGYYHGHSFDDCARFLSPEPGTERLVIGSFCSIGSGAAFIMAGNQGHRHDWVSTFPFYWMPDVPTFAGAVDGYAEFGDITVGSDVWIGSEAVIMAGVTIGHGAVIGTRALVTKDVEPYAIVGGNPARMIRKRFTDEQIALLQEMAWWDWTDEQLTVALPLLTSSDIAGLHHHWLTNIRA